MRLIREAFPKHGRLSSSSSSSSCPLLSSSPVFRPTHLWGICRSMTFFHCRCLSPREAPPPKRDGGIGVVGLLLSPPSPYSLNHRPPLPGLSSFLREQRPRLSSSSSFSPMMDAQVLAYSGLHQLNSHGYTPTQRYSTAPNTEIGESKTNLIINYLPQGMGQEEVRALFASIGEIESCKLVRDKITGQSLGYGFVNYCREDDALKAVASFNGLRLQNKTIKVSYARPSNDDIKGSNLYVSGIPKNMTLNELESIFRPFGQIITSRILSDNVTGLSKGVGFVRFDKKNEAENAIAQLNGTIPPTCTDQITVKFANNPATNSAKTVLQELEAVQQVAAAQSIMPLTLLGATPLRTAAIGPIHHAPLASKYRYSPLAAVTPATAAQATADYYTTALLQMSQLGALGGVTDLSTLAASQAQMAALAGSQSAAAAAATTGASDAGYCLFVYNLSQDTDDSLLWQLFGPFGAVLSIKVVRDYATQKCKGYAFVTMMSYPDACQAVTALNGTQLGSRTLQVSGLVQGSLSSQLSDSLGA